MRRNRRNFCLSRAVLLLSAALGFTTAIHAQISAPEVIDLTSTPDHKRLLIQLNIGGATWNEPFLLDTGSNPLTTAHVDDAPWIGSNHTIDRFRTDHITYGPGSGKDQYKYHPGTASVSFVGSSVSSRPDLPIDFIYEKYTNPDPYNPNPTWTRDAAFHDRIVDAKTTNVPPFEAPVFGTLGADLTDPAHGLMNIVLSQAYGSGLTKGFIINGSVGAPQLTIGPNATMVAEFTSTYSMNATSGSIEKALFSPSYEVTYNGTTSSIGALPTLLDTGTTPETRLFITQGYDVNVSDYTTGGVLNDGVSITMLLAGTPYTLISTASDPIKVFGDPNDHKPGALTFGLNFFREHEVLYNLDSLQVGIRSIPEPPASLYGILAAEALAAIHQWRRRTTRPASTPLGRTPDAPQPLRQRSRQAFGVRR